nr:hypothetical protein [Tanacetum cinerariifolium]
MKSVRSTAPLEKCWKMRKRDSMSYHARGIGASWSTVVKEGELVNAASTGVTISTIRAMTLGAGRSTQGGGLSLWDFFLILPIAQAKHRCTQKFINKFGDLREISSNMLGVVRVQIPENNLDNLHLAREEDGTSKTMVPQDLLGLGASVSKVVGFLRGTLVVVVILVKGHAFPTIVKVRPVGCDPLALVDGFTHVEDNISYFSKNRSLFLSAAVWHLVRVWSGSIFPFFSTRGEWGLWFQSRHASKE